MLVVYLIVVLVMSLITFVFYYIDKKKAQKNKWRIKERTLLMLSILFGALGGMFALYGLRHKNRHWYFVLTNVVSLIIHIIIGIIIGYKLGVWF